MSNEQLERYRKTDEILSKFKNGQELMMKSPAFNMSVQMLVRGVDPYEVIERLVVMTDDTQKAMEQLLIRQR